MSDGCKPLLLELEEKVKECGRLVLRMGGDVMEGAKRRQALEEETHELRMRLARAFALECDRGALSLPASALRRTLGAAGTGVAAGTVERALVVGGGTGFSSVSPGQRFVNNIAVR